jgi:hypothetical protein
MLQTYLEIWLGVGSRKGQPDRQQGDVSPEVAEKQVSAHLGQQISGINIGWGMKEVAAEALRLLKNQVQGVQ